jgi:hypothetical protein
MHQTVYYLNQSNGPMYADIRYSHLSPTTFALSNPEPEKPELTLTGCGLPLSTRADPHFESNESPVWGQIRKLPISNSASAKRRLQSFAHEGMKRGIRTKTEGSNRPGLCAGSRPEQVQQRA